jgi:tetratricopeptide (TPR) repeat protein
MNRKAFLPIILFLITFQANAQKSQLRIARNTIGKLQAAIVAKADVNTQINIVGEGLKATMSAQQDRKTKKYPETWAIGAYLNSYLALIDSKDPDKYYQDALALIDTAKQLDRFHENEKLLDAALLNTFVIKQDKANRAFNNYDYATALGYLKELSDYFPQDSTLALNTAIASQNLRKYDQALIYYNRAIETGAANPVIYQHLAEIYSSKFDVENAIKVLETGQKRNPSNTFILNDLVNMLLDNERYDRAEKALEDAIRLEGRNNKELYYLYGYLKQLKKQHTQAETAYNTALAMDPNYFPALYQLGMVYIEMGKETLKSTKENKLQLYEEQINKSDNILTHAYEIAPNDRQTIQLLIEINTRKQRYDKVDELKERLQEF